MNSKIRLMIAAIAFVSSVDLLRAQKLTAIMYVRTTSEARNRLSERALQNTVERLNAGGRQSGEKFFLTAVGTFSEAINLHSARYAIPKKPRDLEVSAIVVVAHGIFDHNKKYQKMVEDQTYKEAGGIDEAIRIEFEEFFSCSTETISNTDIGKAVAERRGFKYPVPQPTDGKPTSGIWGTGTGGSGYWATVTYNGTIGFMGSDGKYYVVGYSTIVHVWVPTGESPSDVAMS
jgi:hypothetical protein